MHELDGRFGIFGFYTVARKLPQRSPPQWNLNEVPACVTTLGRTHHLQHGSKAVDLLYLIFVTRQEFQPISVALAIPHDSADSHRRARIWRHELNFNAIFHIQFDTRRDRDAAGAEFVSASLEYYGLIRAMRLVVTMNDDPDRYVKT